MEMPVDFEKMTTPDWQSVAEDGEKKLKEKEIVGALISCCQEIIDSKNELTDEKVDKWLQLIDGEIEKYVLLIVDNDIDDNEREQRIHGAKMPFLKLCRFLNNWIEFNHSEGFLADLSVSAQEAIDSLKRVEL